MMAFSGEREQAIRSAMKSELAEECQVLQAASDILKDEHARLAYHGQPVDVLAAHAAKLHTYRERLKDFSERLHEEHERTRRDSFAEHAPHGVDRSMHVNRLIERRR